MLRNAMQMEQESESDTGSTRNIKGLSPVRNFIGSKGAISSLGRENLSSSCPSVRLEGNSDEVARTTQEQTPGQGRGRMDESLFGTDRRFTSNNNTKATDKTASAPELLGSGEVLTRLTQATHQSDKKNLCQGRLGHDHN